MVPALGWLAVVVGPRSCGPAPHTETVTVVRAARELPAGQWLEPGDLCLDAVPRNAFPNTIDPGEAQMGLRVANALFQGQVLVPGQLTLYWPSPTRTLPLPEETSSLRPGLRIALQREGGGLLEDIVVVSHADPQEILVSVPPDQLAAFDALVSEGDVTVLVPVQGPQGQFKRCPKDLKVQWPRNRCHLVNVCLLGGPSLEIWRDKDGRPCDPPPELGR